MKRAKCTKKTLENIAHNQSKILAQVNGHRVRAVEVTFYNDRLAAHMRND